MASELGVMHRWKSGNGASNGDTAVVVSEGHHLGTNKALFGVQLTRNGKVVIIEKCGVTFSGHGPFLSAEEAARSPACLLYTSPSPRDRG